MKPTSVDIPLHDIGPLIYVPDYSIYWFMFLVTAVLAAILVFIKEMRVRNRSKQRDERSLRYESFAHINMDDPKAAAYAISKQGEFFAHDNEETLTLYRTLFKRLEPYKYAPNVEPIDEECLSLYHAYAKMIEI